MHTTHSTQHYFPVREDKHPRLDEQKYSIYEIPIVDILHICNVKVINGRLFLIYLRGLVLVDQENQSQYTLLIEITLQQNKNTVSLKENYSWAFAILRMVAKKLIVHCILALTHLKNRAAIAGVES